MTLNLFIQCEAKYHNLSELGENPAIGTFLGKDTEKGRIAISPVFNELVCLLDWARECGFKKTGPMEYILPERN